MIALGLSSADLALFNRSLSTHHSVKVTVQILTLDHAYLGDLTSRLLDGQVSIDAAAEVTRSLTMQLNDPDGKLQLDSTSPADGALFYDRMIRVIYSVKSTLLPRWVDVSIFCGPITKMSRTADIINVECQGKESLALPPTLAYFSRTWAKGINRAALVKALMVQMGETRFSFPAYGDRTSGPTTVISETNVWALAKAVNGSFANRQLFYDGRGVLVMRSTPKTPTYTFKTGVGGSITTTPTVDYDIADVRNVVRVKGAIPKGKKTPVVGTVAIPASHPLTPGRMGRGGKSRILLEVISDDNIKTVAQARALAQSRVNALALQTVDVKFDALIAPHLEPMDIYRLQTADFSVLARVTQMTIPLKASTSSIGYLMKRQPNRSRVRRRR